MNTTESTAKRRDGQDALGRKWCNVTGWGRMGVQIPVGSRVLIEAERETGGLTCNIFTGLEAIVVRVKQDTLDWHSEVVVRLVEPQCEREEHNNWARVEARRLYVIRAGDGTPPEAGRDWRKTAWTVKQERFAALDHTHQGFANPPTAMAGMYLANDPRHVAAIDAMLRADGTINPERLASYINGRGRSAPLVIDEWAWHRDGYPEADFRYRIDAGELAAHFAQMAREKREKRDAGSLVAA